MLFAGCFATNPEGNFARILWKHQKSVGRKCRHCLRCVEPSARAKTIEATGGNVLHGWHWHKIAWRRGGIRAEPDQRRKVKAEYFRICLFQIYIFSVFIACPVRPFRCPTGSDWFWHSRRKQQGRHANGLPPSAHEIWGHTKSNWPFCPPPSNIHKGMKAPKGPQQMEPKRKRRRRKNRQQKKKKQRGIKSFILNYCKWVWLYKNGIEKTKISSIHLHIPPAGPNALSLPQIYMCINFKNLKLYHQFIHAFMYTSNI